MAVSEEMIREGVIDRSLMNMDTSEFDLAIPLIFENERFIEKDSTGNKMYSNALRHFRLYLASNSLTRRAEERELRQIENDRLLTATERETIIKSRIGQGRYRESLLEKYGNRCIITHINIPEILVASHIKPWCVSNNRERVSENNGLLLSATYDRLFDQGLISFENNGTIMISGRLSNENARRLELRPREVYDIRYDPGMRDFLEYHRELIFVRYAYQNFQTPMNNYWEAIVFRAQRAHEV